MRESRIISTPKTLLRLLNSGGESWGNTTAAITELPESMLQYLENLEVGGLRIPSTMTALWACLVIPIMLVVIPTWLLLSLAFAAITLPLSSLLLLWLAIATKLRNS